jgi:hypothetical protein
MARSNRISGKGGRLIDTGVAALAALSAGFVTYAMPEALFSRLITASHLPDFLAAAQPPLGMKARLAVIAVAILVVYAFVWTLLRAIDSIGAKRPAAPADAGEEAPPPRLRRADAHPDAPSRRPIFAGRDLGEPGFDGEPLELEPETALAAEPEPEFEPQPAAEPLPAFLVPQPEAEAEPVTAAQQGPDDFAEHSFHESSDEPEEESGEEEEATAPEGDDQSLTRLMQRFESGLGRKQQALEAAPPASVPEPEPVPQERVGHRLRSAISDLGKISAPGR